MPLLVEPLTNSYFQQKIITCLKDLTFFLCAYAINLEVSDLHFNNNIFMWLTITSTCCISRVWSIYFTTHTLRSSLQFVYSLFTRSPFCDYWTIKSKVLLNRLILFKQIRRHQHLVAKFSVNYVPMTKYCIGNYIDFGSEFSII